MSSGKKMPLRTCVGCGEKKEKKELLRVLRTPEGTVVLDAAGRRNGRGAYLCRSAACLEKAVKRRSLARALDVQIPDEVFSELKKEMMLLEQG